MKRLVVAAVAALLVTSAPTAHAMTWTIGPNLDIVSHNGKDGGEDLSRVELPAAVGGLRVGFPMRRENASLFFDTGLAASSGGGTRQNHWALIANLQWAFAPQATWTAYVNGGSGVRYVSIHTDESLSAASLTYGLGVGLRKRWGDSATVRGELRWDQVTDGEDGGVVVVPGGSEIGVRLGFDLWVK